jgi:hypothetical protein
MLINVAISGERNVIKREAILGTAHVLPEVLM